MLDSIFSGAGASPQLTSSFTPSHLQYNLATSFVITTLRGSIINHQIIKLNLFLMQEDDEFEEFEQEQWDIR